MSDRLIIPDGCSVPASSVEFLLADGTLTEAGVTKMEEYMQAGLQKMLATHDPNMDEVTEGITQLYANEQAPLPPWTICDSPAVLIMSGLVGTVYWAMEDLGNSKDAVHRAHGEWLTINDKLCRESAVKPLSAVLPEQHVWMFEHETADSLTADPRFQALTNAKASLTELQISLAEYVHGGNMWPSAVSQSKCCREVFGLDWPIFTQILRPWELLAANTSYRWIHDRFCILSRFCEQTVLDPTFQNITAHCDNGPVVTWKDGIKLWGINGHIVTEQIVMYPETITAEQIAAEQNADIRSIMLERKGYEKYVEELGISPIDREELYRLHDGTTVFEKFDFKAGVATRYFGPSELINCFTFSRWLETNPADVLSTTRQIGNSPSYAKESGLDPLDQEEVYTMPGGESLLLTFCPSGNKIIPLLGLPGLETCDDFRSWYHGESGEPTNVVART